MAEGYSGLDQKHNQAAAIVAQLTTAEKAMLCSGKDFWHLHGMERLKVPAVMVTDGPHGLRKQDSSSDQVGLHRSVPATCFPTAVTLAATWNTQLLENIGAALAAECIEEDVAVLLGPGLNIKRHPYCGRNFEYFSEDPHLSGKMAAALVKGLQANGVGACLKHFAVNNQERARMIVDAVVDERTMREIYLRGFEIAVKEAQPWSVMCAYNRVNGTYCSEHSWLLNDVLRKEWGFKGMVMTDWGASNDRVEGIMGGLDLEMPGSGGVNTPHIEAAVEDGSLPVGELDRAVRRNIAVSLLGADVQAASHPFDPIDHHNLARQAAIEGSVLLKNQDNFLPLADTGTFAVIGALAKHPRYQGAGSSQVNPSQTETPWSAIAEYTDARLYAPGYVLDSTEEDPQLIKDAVMAANQVDTVILFAGLPPIYESEGFDRDTLQLPPQHERLIAAVCEANPNTVVVLNNGSAVSMPWVSLPKAVLEAYLPGQAGGTAIADLLFGAANPSGKLAETFAWSIHDVPSDPYFPGNDKQVEYREGLNVGYRYFSTTRTPSMFPFGHGLSYTRFRYAASRCTQAADDSTSVTVSVEVTNTGKVEGAEVVQLYVRDCESSVYRPDRELRAFDKVILDPGEARVVKFQLERDAFTFYDVGQRDWIVESGDFEILIGASSEDIRAQHRIHVEGDQKASPLAQRTHPPGSRGVNKIVTDQRFEQMLDKPIPKPQAVQPFHYNSSVGDLAETSAGRKVQERLMSEFLASMGGTSKDKTLNKMFEEMAKTMPLRAIVLFSRGKFSYAQLDMLLASLNRQPLKAAQAWLRSRKEK